jgi:hypothetical protein
MKDLEELLESTEMANVVRAIESLQRKYMPAELLGVSLEDVVELTTSPEFSPREVMELLLEENRSHPVFRPILAASLNGWLIDPHDEATRGILVSHVALRHMRQIDAKFARFKHISVEEDIAQRYVLTGTDFLLDVFVRLGGYNTLANMPSEEQFDVAASDTEIKAIKTAARAVAYFHHAVNRFNVSDFKLGLSLSRAVAIFDILRDSKNNYPSKSRLVARSVLHARWSQNKSTLALFYAASTIWHGRKTLLDILLDGSFSYTRHHKHLINWFKRSRFVVDHVLSRMGDPTLSAINRTVLPSIDGAEFAPPQLDAHETAAFDSAFRQFIRRLSQ